MTRLLRAREATLVILIILIGLALQLITGRFLTTPNLNAISLGFATSAIMVFGMTAALASGGSAVGRLGVRAWRRDGCHGAARSRRHSARGAGGDWRGRAGRLDQRAADYANSDQPVHYDARHDGHRARRQPGGDRRHDCRRIPQEYFVCRQGKTLEVPT
ncbi:MAG: hypothetical protein U0703_25995 [Anaerolineae bacterium]